MINREHMRKIRFNKLFIVFLTIIIFLSISSAVKAACTDHSQCSQVCTTLCPYGVYGCCYGCNLGQCVSSVCQCTVATAYCSGSPSYQVGSPCGAACSGTTTLSRSPTSGPSGTTITFTGGGLSSCNGKTFYFNRKSAPGVPDFGNCGASPSVASCSVSGSGCSASFSESGPYGAGTYTYVSCVDKNGDGDWADAGEQSSAASFTLTAGTYSYTVAVSGLNNAYTRLYRDGGDVGCLSSTGTYGCSQSNTWSGLSGSHTASVQSTVTYSGVTCNIVGSSSVGFSSAGSYTFSYSCSTPCTPSCKYDCNPVIGSIGFSPNPVTQGYSTTASTSGWGSLCNGWTFYVRTPGCTGSYSQKCSGTINSAGSGSCSFTASDSPGAYQYQSCIDRNNNGNQADFGEQSYAGTLTISGGTYSYTVAVSGLNNAYTRLYRDGGDVGCLSSTGTYGCSQSNTWSGLSGSHTASVQSTVTYSGVTCNIVGSSSVGFSSAGSYTFSYSCSTACTTCNLQSPTINPSSPTAGSTFTITCPGGSAASPTGACRNYGGSDLWCNGISAGTNWNSWTGCSFAAWTTSGSQFNCPAHPAGTYTASCQVYSGNACWSGTTCGEGPTSRSFTVSGGGTTQIQSFGLDPVTPTATVGNSVLISGYLKDSFGNPLGNQIICLIYYNANDGKSPPGSWDGVCQFSMATNSSGKFGTWLTYTPVPGKVSGINAAGWAAYFAGGGGYSSTYTTMSHTVNDNLPTLLISASPTSVISGDTVTTTGSLRDGTVPCTSSNGLCQSCAANCGYCTCVTSQGTCQSYPTVTLQYRLSGGSWTNASSINTGGDGSYTLYWTAPSVSTATTYFVRTNYAGDTWLRNCFNSAIGGDGDYDPVASSEVQITVNPSVCTPSCKYDCNPVIGSISFSPNPVTQNNGVTAITSGWGSLCNGWTFYVRTPGCTGSYSQKCQGTIGSGGSGSCSFTATDSPGTYQYQSCIDRNNNGNTADFGEQSWAGSLTIVCSNLCSPSGTKRCNGNTVEICSDCVGGDGCLEWCSYQNCDASDAYICSGTNRCGTSEGDTRYYRDYYCSGGNCLYTDSSLGDCDCSASDTDGGQDVYTTGTCTDYTGCSGTSCGSSSYTDTCSGTSVREYYVSGSGNSATCTYTDLSCPSGYTCSGGRCIVSTYTLTVTKAGTGSGTVTSSPAGISCGSDCSEAYNSGTSVTLTAAAASGSTFASWSGDCSGTGTCALTMNSNKSVTATFNITTYTLTVTKAGTGSGTVTSSPAGISCGSDCSEAYNSGTSVTLTAAAASGSTFASWSGDCSGTGTCALTMNSNKSVTATFNYPTYVISPSSATKQVGQTQQFTGLYDPDGPSGSQAEQNVTNSASWSSSNTTIATINSSGLATCNSTGSVTITSVYSGITATASLTCSAIPTYTLTVSKSGTGSGTVTSSPAGISCGSDCSEAYNSGTSVTLTAAAASGSTFAGWSGACSGTGSCTLTMDSNKSVTATFNETGCNLNRTGDHTVNYPCVLEGAHHLVNGNLTITSGGYIQMNPNSSFAFDAGKKIIIEGTSYILKSAENTIIQQ